MRAPREWGEEEIVQLTKLYEEFKDAIDPANRILENLTVKRPKKRVVDKIMGKHFYFKPLKKSHISFSFVQSWDYAMTKRS